jgi:general secretion pathway protein D
MLGFVTSLTLHAADKTPGESSAAEPAQTKPAESMFPTVAAPSPPDAADREHMRNRLLWDVAQSWQRPAAVISRAADGTEAVAADPITEKLNAIVLPTVSFTRVPIGQVVAALGAASEEFDRAETVPKGINLVLLDAENRAPLVTLTLRNASLRRVLDFVTESIGYQYEVQADAVVLRPGGETSSLQTQFFPVTRATVLRLAGRSENAPASGVSAGKRTPPNSLRAEDESVSGAARGSEAAAIRAFLQLAGVGFDAVPGASLAYDGSAIIATQTPRNLERMRTLLARYREVRQVEIEAKFMEVQDGALEELGVNWTLATKPGQANAGAQAVYTTGNRTLAGTFTNNSSAPQGSIIRPEGTVIAADGTTTISPGLNLPIINNPPLIPGTADLAAGATPLAAVTGVLGEFDVTAVMRALSLRQGTDLLSAPKVTVLSGNAATITVAQEMRYPQSFGQTQSQVGTGSANGGGSAGVAITAGTPQDFTSRNVGVELRVTPTVEDDGTSISLDLNPRVTEFDGFVEFGGPSIAISGGTTVTVPSGFYQPIFSVRDISTRVTIWDGATLVMGGLTREEVKKVHDKVPLLGDLPLLGRLFRSTGESAQKRNLVIFVTATLVNPGGAPKKSRTRPEEPISSPGKTNLTKTGSADRKTPPMSDQR